MAQRRWRGSSRGDHKLSWDEDDGDVGCPGSIQVAGASVAERECSTSEWPVPLEALREL